MANKEKMHTAKMSVNGQLVIPVKIREAAGLKPGMRFLVGHEAGNIVLTPQATPGLKEETAQVESADGNESNESEF